jgi:hypothetical protein
MDVIEHAIRRSCVVHSGWMVIMKLKYIEYKVDKINKIYCIGRRLYVAWKANSHLLSADDCWCGCSLWHSYAIIEVGWPSFVITILSVVMLCGANDRTCGQQKLGSSITTMHPLTLLIWSKVFLTKHNIPWFVRLPTLQTWPLVIFGCSPNWNGPDLSQEKTLCRTLQPSWTWFHKKISRNVSSNGSTAGRSVCITKETALKGIWVSDVQINNCICAEQRSDTFWTDV